MAQIPKGRLVKGPKFKQYVGTVLAVLFNYVWNPETDPIACHWKHFFHLHMYLHQVVHLSYGTVLRHTQAGSCPSCHTMACLILGEDSNQQLPSTLPPFHPASLQCQGASPAVKCCAKACAPPKPKASSWEMAIGINSSHQFPRGLYAIPYYYILLIHIQRHSRVLCAHCKESLLIKSGMGFPMHGTPWSHVKTCKSLGQVCFHRYFLGVDC